MMCETTRLTLDFESLPHLQQWVAAGAALGWLPPGALLYEGPGGFVVRADPAAVVPAPAAVPFEKTLAPTTGHAPTDPYRSNLEEG
jgi:hypothetical protein